MSPPELARRPASRSGMAENSGSCGWLPRGFLDRVGAALVAPRHALQAADRARAEGKTAGDAMVLVAISFVAIYTRQIAVALWISAADSVQVGVQLLLGTLSQALAMKLAALFLAGLTLTVVAGRRRSLGRDFDLACVAFVPLIAIELASALLVRGAAVLGTNLGPVFHASAQAVAYGWAIVVLILAWLQIRHRVVAGQASPPIHASGKGVTT